MAHEGPADILIIVNDLVSLGLRLLGLAGQSAGASRSGDVVVKISTSGCGNRMNQIGDGSNYWVWKHASDALWQNMWSKSDYDGARFVRCAKNALQRAHNLTADVVFDATELWKLGSRPENSTAATMSLGIYIFNSIVLGFINLLYLFISISV